MRCDRRFVIRNGSLALVGLGAVPSFLQRLTLASPGATRKILIAIFQRGASDGLNVVVPFREPRYYQLRPSIAIPAPKTGQQDTAIDLDGQFGLHPALQPMEALFRSRHLAVIHAVGSPDSTRSHFDAQDYMETATPGVKSTDDGWLNRHLQTASAKDESPFRAIAVGTGLPRSLKGRAPALAMSNIRSFDLHTGRASALNSTFERLYGASSDTLLGGNGRETFEAIRFLKRIDPERYQPEAGVEYPRGRLGSSLRQVAQLIKAGSGLEVAFVESGGWDHHVAEGGVEGQLANRLRELGQGLSALGRDLEKDLDRIVILTMSEFGRTVQENGSRGTDHGHANCMLVLGGPVAGGKVYGQWPGLNPEQLFEGRDLALTTDFRDVFGETVQNHLGNRKVERVFPGYDIDPRKFCGFIRRS
ncbi:MAG: DUF1501 domain-containing protein [Acidobacteriota bacterium]